MAGKAKVLYNKDDIYIDNLGRWIAISLCNGKKKIIIITVYKIPVAAE